jgi:hypothetical protein
MRKLALVPALAAGAAIAVGGPAMAAGGDKVINVRLDGKQEVPKGAPKGSGAGKITLKPSKGQVCFSLTWKGIGTPNAAHIHKGAKGVAGPVVVPLFATPPKHSGCVSATKSVVSAIAKSPASYYVNIHTAKYPAGALRGQL